MSVDVTTCPAIVTGQAFIEPTLSDQALIEQAAFRVGGCSNALNPNFPETNVYELREEKAFERTVYSPTA
jgi:hypothetical protein